MLALERGDPHETGLRMGDSDQLERSFDAFPLP